MKHIFTLILFALMFLNASGLQVTSKDFYYKDGDNKAEFSGNVIAKEGESVLNSDKLIVLLDDKNEAKKYKAIGNVSFNIKNSKKRRDINGTCDTATYIPAKDKYILVGNVVLHDNLKDRDVFGDEIIIDQKGSFTSAKSKGKKPVKFIFNTQKK